MTEDADSTANTTERNDTTVNATDRSDATDGVTRRTVVRTLAGAAGLAATSALSGCLSGEARPLAPENSIRVTQVLPPRKLDPIAYVDQWTAQVGGQVFEGLYTYDRGMNPVPVLATGPPKQTGKTTFEVPIREEARFQNDAPVTATDVRYSLEAPVREATPRKPALEPIESVTPKDETTVEVELAHPFPGLIDALTQPIVPKAERVDDREAFGSEEPVGSGPYEATIVSPGTHVEFEAWEDYWGEPAPEIDHAAFVGNHSGLARTTSLKSGQADVVEDVQPKLWEATKEIPTARVTRTPSFRYYFVGFNCNDGPMADPETREAVDYTFDVDEIVEHFVGPTGTRQYGPLPPRMAEAWNMPVTEWRRIPRRKNVDRAKRLFAKTVRRDESTPAGWQPTVAVPAHDMLREKVGETIVQGLKEAGFSRARVRKYGWEEFREKTTSGSSSEYDLFVGAWSGGPDPDTFVYPLFHENAEGLTNGTFYQDEAVMEAVDAARRTTDRTRRSKLYERAIGTLLEERVHLPAFSLYETFGVKSRVEGFSPHPLPSANPELAGPNGVLTLQDG